MTYDYPEHCDECGAYLSTKTDQDTHAAWHLTLTKTLTDIARTANSAHAWNQVIG